jgi:lipopolysaccharide transport system permease protein
MPLSIFLSSLVRLGIQLVLLLSLYLYFVLAKGFHFNFTAQIFFVPIILLCLALIGLGFGMIISSLTTKYRDLNNFLLFGIQLLMYATPVVYPLSGTPQKYKEFLSLNPLAPLIEGLRSCLLGVGSFHPISLVYPLIFMIVAFVIGVLVFNSAEKDFVDTI